MFDKTTREAKKHVLDGKNECSLTFTFGNTPQTMAQARLDVNCTKSQMLLAFFILATKFERQDIGFVQSLIDCFTEKMDTSVEHMLEVAKKVFNEEKK